MQRAFIVFLGVTATCPQALGAQQPSMPAIGGEARISSSAKAGFEIVKWQPFGGTTGGTSQPDEE